VRLGIFAKTFAGTDPVTVLHAAKEAGYASVQYNFACSGLAALPRVIPDSVIARLQLAVRESGVAIAAISATYNMLALDPVARLAGREAFSAIAQAARLLDVKLVTVCTGSRHPTDQWSHHPDNRTPEAWDAMVKEMVLLEQIADLQDVFIGVEPEHANAVYSAERAQALIDSCRSKRIRIVFDPANLVEHAPVSQHAEIIADAAQRLGRHTALVHAKDRDADGRVVAAGQGVIDFKTCLELLRGHGFDGDVVTHGLTSAEAKAAGLNLLRIMEKQQ
jgi:sugar phosphate isomerase/epimerase